MSQPAAWGRKTVTTTTFSWSLGLLAYCGFWSISRTGHWSRIWAFWFIGWPYPWPAGCWSLQSPLSVGWIHDSTYRNRQYRSSAVRSTVRVPAGCAAAQLDQNQAIIASATALHTCASPPSARVLASSTSYCVSLGQTLKVWISHQSWRMRVSEFPICTIFISWDAWLLIN